MVNDLDARFYIWLRRVALILTSVVITVGIAVFCGWYLDVDLLKRPIPHLVAMNPLTAISFICTAISFLLLQPKSVSADKLLLGGVFAVLPLSFAVLRLAGFFSSWDFEVDSILFHHKLLADSPGNLSSRMAPNTAMNFVFVSIALLCLHGFRGLRRIGVPILAYATCIGSIVAIIGYGYRVQIFYGELASFPMAIHTALCFLFMGVALLCIRPEYGGISEIASTFSGGYTGRILIVAALIVPFTLGMAALYGYWRGYYTTELAIGLLVFTLMLALCILIWRNTSELNLRDKQQAAIARSLEDANKSLLRMNAELDSFAYISSHDLQEPLRKIKIFSGMINDPVRKDIDYHEYARKINESADRMSGLINGLLVFSKLNSTNEAFESTDLNYIIRDVLTDYELTIKEKNAVINVSALPVINAIPLQMRQLFFNLIGNALKFNNGEPHISIQALDADPDTIASLSSNGKNKYCKLVIEDNGIGFEQEYADKIFIVFQRLQSQYTGSGIGLAICKKIIENHNGSIKAFSKPGEGTTFEIFIPQ